MLDNEHIPQPYRDLIDAYLDGTIHAEDLATLEAWLIENESARQYFVRYSQLHTDLYPEAKAERAVHTAINTIVQEAETKVIPTPRRTVISRLLPSLVMAVALLMAVTVGWFVADQQTERQEIAWLTNAQNCRWKDGQSPKSGLYPGSVLTLESGLAEIHFRSGADVILEGPAKLVFESAMRAKLSHGKLTANVPETAHGFAIVSPHGKVVDLGTEFGLSVGPSGQTDVTVFQGEVEVFPDADKRRLLKTNQSAQFKNADLQMVSLNSQFKRKIQLPPTIVPRTLHLDFSTPVPNTLLDGNGMGTGLTARLIGTGTDLKKQDENLRLNRELGILELGTTQSDLNHQFKIRQGEYLGNYLSELGFTGKEDFEVQVRIKDIPSLKTVGQFGLFVGAKSDKNIRGGLVSKREPRMYRQHLVNNNGGKDSNANFIGLESAGDDLRLTLRRVAGQYTSTTENETSGASSTLKIRHPEFLDNEPDLLVGIYAATPRDTEPSKVLIDEYRITVQTIVMPE